MEGWERQSAVDRVVAGTWWCTLREDTHVLRYEVRHPSRSARAAASERYADAYSRAADAGIPSADESRVLLAACGVWTDAMSEQKAELEKALEEGKVGLCDLFGKPGAAEVRAALAATRARLETLYGTYHLLDGFSREGVASASRVRYLAGCSLVRPDGLPYWPDPDTAWREPDAVLEEVLEASASQRLSEAGVRELARTEPWRSVWGVARHTGRGLFDTAAADLTDDQRVLVLWSAVYDSLRDHPDLPSDELLEDDDATDGWMILQRRKREDAKGMRTDDIRNEKVRNSDEVFLPAVDAAEARRIDKKNSLEARMTRAQRLGHVAKHGEVAEAAMPDTVLKLRNLAAQGRV